MVNTVESKLDPSSRHFGLIKPKARSSTSLVGKARRPLQKQQLPVLSRHISRKDLFYGSQSSRNGQTLQNIKKNQSLIPKAKVAKHKAFVKEDPLLSRDETNKTMHPEQVQLSHPVENLVEEKLLKPQDVVEDEIDIEEVDNGDFNGGTKEEQNGNGLHMKENGHPQHESGRNEAAEDKLQADTNGAEAKPVMRLKGSRRNSTSSRSSSVSSAPSLKHQTPLAMQMEVSMDFDERDHMDPLIIEGNAEDLEVSMSASHDEADDGATTDSEAITEQPNDPYEFDDDLEPDYEPEILQKKTKSVKAAKGSKAAKPSPKPKSVKPKAPRAKSQKSKAPKTSPKLTEKLLEEIDAENSDTNSLYKDDTESEDLNIKPQKSPKRSKTTPTKLDAVEESEGEAKGCEAEHVPRRSSRSRHTPQKYNSSLYADWDHQLPSEDRNNSDAVYGASIRSVKGRRSLRKSRNISVLNTSLHNESSPWDNDFKVLTPCGGGVSIHTAPETDNIESSTPLKRKAVEEDDDIENDRGQKKMCVENTDLNTSTSSHTSSFFSVITSPIIMLKNKFRGSSVSSSTPVRETKPAEIVEQEMPSEIDIDIEKETKEDDVPEKEVVPEEEGTSVEDTIDVDVVTPPPEVPAVEVAQEAKSWCSIM